MTENRYFAILKLRLMIADNTFYPKFLTLSEYESLSIEEKGYYDLCGE